MIHVAPFLGEFGWLVAMWLPWLRHRRMLDATREFEVFCMRGQRGLFETEDMNWTVREIDPGDLPFEIEKVDCENVWTDKGRLTRDSYLHLLQRFTTGRQKARKNAHISPFHMEYVWPSKGPPEPRRANWPDFDSERRHVTGQVFVHARMCKKQPERNWPRERWDELQRVQDRSFIAVGHPEHSYVPAGAIDRRGLSIAEEIRELSYAKCIVGPSSGPLHLANLCRVPAIWWAAGGKNVARYNEKWNPHGVRNRNVVMNWNPSVAQVQMVLDA